MKSFQAPSFGPTSSPQRIQFSVPCPTGRVRTVRKGIFFASDLTESNEAKQYHKEFPHIDKQCIIRFPQKYAALLRSRLQESETNKTSSPGSEGNGPALGLRITPTAKEDYRIFNVTIDESIPGGFNETGEQVMISSRKNLVGVLVELPCCVESYKTFDGDLFFKAGDVSQMIYVYDPTVEDFDIDKIKNTAYWEWRSGITPATYRIRTRKFRNFEVFEKQDIQAGEKELLELIRGLDRDSVAFDALSEFEMNNQLETFRSGGLPNEPNVTFVVGPGDNIFDEEGIDTSDLSDRLFMDENGGEEEEEECYADGEGVDWSQFRVDEYGNVVPAGEVWSDRSSNVSSRSDMDERRTQRRQEKRQRKEKRRKRKEEKEEKKKKMIVEQQQTDLDHFVLQESEQVGQLDKVPGTMRDINDETNLND